MGSATITSHPLLLPPGRMEKQLWGRSGLYPHHPHSQVARGCSYPLERVAGPLICSPKETRHRPCTGTHRLARHIYLNACFLGKFLQALPKWVRYRPQRGPDNMPQVPGFPGRWSCSKSSGLYRSPAKMCNYLGQLP